MTRKLRKGDKVKVTDKTQKLSELQKSYLGKIGIVSDNDYEVPLVTFDDGTGVNFDNKKLELVINEPAKEEPSEPTKYIRRFPSGAVRSDDRGRIRPDYISPYALEAIAEHFTGNKNDFGATNYFNGIRPHDCNPSISRHYLDLQKGFATNDSKLIYEELKALAANCIMALHQIKIEEAGLYKEPFAKTEYVPQEEYLAQTEQ